MNKIMLLLLSSTIILWAQASAADTFELCDAQDRACIIKMLISSAEKIEQNSWRDQIYRELAKTLAFDGLYDEAIATLEKIENPDTRALTIRGIGMAVAETGINSVPYNDVFFKLRQQANAITHPPSYAIALTYIAMAQAFAGDNEGAWETAADMENEALRHKAYGETAEIQAEKGDFIAAMKSISMIESEAYQNKAYSITSKIFADTALYNDALGAAQKVSNPYKRANALQYILDKQKPRELVRD